MSRVEEDSQRLIPLIDALRELRGEVARDAQRSAQLTALRVWQGERLARTHADLLQSERYRLPSRFFLDDLYGHADPVGRDASLARVAPLLERFLPDGALAVVVDAVGLDLLTERLDQDLAARIWPAGGDGPSGPWVITPQAYADAMRAQGRAGRDEQVARVKVLGEELDRLVRKPLLGQLLRAMGGPARQAGLEHLHGFLQRGFQAFKAMGGARAFLDLITTRESAQIDRLMAGGLPD